MLHVSRANTLRKSKETPRFDVYDDLKAQEISRDRIV
jgi:hypothetical protein